MADTVFRTKTESTPTSAPSENKVGSNVSVSTTSVEVPYLDYSREHGHPHSVDYFKLGDTWKDPVGGFHKEVSAVEDYFNELIENGDIPNSITAVKDRLKSMLKVTNMDKEERNVIKMEVLASYVNFLRQSSDIKRNVKRYGNS